jgi:hypothetical protein
MTDDSELIVPDTITFMSSDGRIHHHPASFIYEEMRSRSWTSRELAREWGGDREASIKALAVDMYLANASQPMMRMGEMAADMDRVFGTVPGFFAALERKWLEETGGAVKLELVP